LVHTHYHFSSWPKNKVTARKTGDENDKASTSKKVMSSTIKKPVRKGRRPTASAESEFVFDDALTVNPNKMEIQYDSYGDQMVWCKPMWGKNSKKVIFHEFS
jgi:hypothetical protein